MPAIARLSVRGIGVADRVRTSTSRRSCLSRSLAATPKRCSSSTTTRPRSLNRTSFESSRCVPMTRSTVPSARPGDRRRLRLRRHEARQQPDLERERREPLAERRVVLGREDGRRDEHRDLLVVLGRLERGPQRDLGLAVADVADDEPVHRSLLLHVGLDLDGGAQLVDRLLVRERGLQLALPRRVLAERRGPGRWPARRTARAARRPGPRRPCGRAAWRAATRCRRACSGAGARRRRSA